MWWESHWHAKCWSENHTGRLIFFVKVGSPASSIPTEQDQHTKISISTSAENSDSIHVQPQQKTQTLGGTLLPVYSAWQKRSASRIIFYLGHPTSGRFKYSNPVPTFWAQYLRDRRDFWCANTSVKSRNRYSKTTTVTGLLGLAWQPALSTISHSMRWDWSKPFMVLDADWPKEHAGFGGFLRAQILKKLRSL